MAATSAMIGNGVRHVNGVDAVLGGVSLGNDGGERLSDVSAPIGDAARRSAAGPVVRGTAQRPDVARWSAVKTATMRDSPHQATIHARDERMSVRARSGMPWRAGSARAITSRPCR
jgi:hypothetical protein